MKKIWKWLLGILIVLVVVGLLAGAALMVRNRMGVVAANRAAPSADGWNNSPMMRGNDGQNRGPMMRGNNGFNGSPMMGGRGGFGFFGPIVFLGGLLKLAFFGAVIYGAYWLGKRNARIAIDPRPAAPAPAPKENE
jgi:hypothetical protein